MRTASEITRRPSHSKLQILSPLQSVCPLSLHVPGTSGVVVGSAAELPVAEESLQSPKLVHMAEKAQSILFISENFI